MKRNPIGYRTVTRMEEESAGRNEERAQHEGPAEERTTASEQAAQDHFEAGGWQREAEETAADEERMADLDNKREEFTRKNGLSRVRQQLVLLWDYLSAITSGCCSGLVPRIRTFGTSSLSADTVPLGIDRILLSLRRRHPLPCLPNREYIQLLLNQSADIDYDGYIVQPTDPRKEIRDQI